ncbi:chalcone isomerase family protein [Burkholderia sp. Ac-20379]|uniref:chalcone isomerase family protein n=1 Tax=Burkholderia sp. Ac-20379 TaxID=2703900 RepID=UPI00403FB7B0
MRVPGTAAARGLIGLAIAAGAACAFASAGAGVPADCRNDVPSARLIGSGEFCVLGFCLYDAALWASRAPTGDDVPFALALTYRRTIRAERLVEVGMDEIRRLAPAPLPEATLAAWRADMRRAFQDVGPGDSLCGVYLPGHGARFYANDTLKADIDDPAFAAAFFGIWLDPKTRAERLRRKLLGGQP